MKHALITAVLSLALTLFIVLSWIGLTPEDRGRKDAERIAARCGALA